MSVSYSRRVEMFILMFASSYDVAVICAWADEPTAPDESPLEADDVMLLVSAGATVAWTFETAKASSRTNTANAVSAIP